MIIQKLTEIREKFLNRNSCEMFTKVSRAIEENNPKWEILWTKAFKRHLYGFGFNKISQNNLFEWGEHGHNWELLWGNEKLNKKEWKENLQWEIFYCSDKMTLDRLFRCNWDYHQYLRCEN